jgi:hypothetical protein
MAPPKCAREKLVLELPNELANLLRLESGGLYHINDIMCEHYSHCEQCQLASTLAHQENPI